MVKRYVFIRVDKDAKRSLDERIKNINQIDLKKFKDLGKKQRVKQIDLTNFLLKNKIFISDLELKKMARGERLC